MRAGTKLAILAATAALVLGSCEFWDALWSGDPAQDRVSYPDEALSLVGLEEAAYSRAVSRAVGARAGLAPPGGASLTLVAEIDPPLGADGQPLQASHVFLQPNGKYALVSYMTRGAEVGGALDLVDVTSEPRRPRIVDTMRFPDFDVAVVCEGGGTIYLGGQLRDQGAYVKTLGFRGDSLEEAGTLTKLWHGAAFATDLALVGNATLYVTTGADGAGSGVYKLAASNLEIQTSQLSGFPDARSLAATSDEVFVYDAGTGAPDSRLARLDSALALTGQNDSLDAYPALDEAKSKLALGKNGAGLYLALNKSGLLVLDPATLAIRTRLPAPVIGGIDSDKLSTNAAAFGFARSKDILLVANGEGGLWVGDAAALAAASTDDAARASLSGTIRFGPGESVNYADAKSGTIVVASGLGGVKVVLME